MYTKDQFSTAILGFDGTEYAFMSNFEYCHVWFEGVEYKTTEHAFQAAKTIRPHERDEFRFCATPGQAKKLGQKITLRDNWDQIKPLIMLGLLTQKFTIPEYQQALIETGDSYLEETNSWNDVYWGVCKGVGKNMLGQQLMYLRELLK